MHVSAANVVVNAALFSCLAYSACSVLMTLSNKAMFATLNLYSYPMLILFYQQVVTLILVMASKFAGVGAAASLQLSWDPMVLKRWLPVNIIFMAMIITSPLALRVLSVAMVVVLKNAATIFSCIGDYFIYGNKEALQPTTLGCIALMVVSALAAGYNDLHFNFQGYAWMFVNCIFTAGNVLYMKHVSRDLKLSDMTMVWYNNTLGLLVLMPLLHFSGELPRAIEAFQSMHGVDLTSAFLLILSGVSGFLMSIASFWAMSSNAPSTYSMVGSLNKIPVAILGFMLFPDSKVTMAGAISIAVGVLSGTLYTYAKYRYSVQARKQALAETEEL